MDRGASVVLVLALVQVRVQVQGLAASDGWTPIIPDSGPGSGSGSGRHVGLSLAVEPGLGPGLGLPGVLTRLGGFHTHTYRPPPSPSPSPLPHPPPPHVVAQAGEACTLYKAAMTQDLYFQYIQYKVHMPDLKEFTLCMWHKFYNHSSDHPLFSYATRDTPRAILSWVTATDRSTYFSMSVDGHTLYRLNYPLRLNRWYHSCQSWNGKTGEWQVWVNAERVGRGFHNLLVKHVIRGGGVAITGQEQRQLGGGFLEGEGAPKGAGGMLGEVTQLYMYGVALTAGKAYRDHKHHHGNYITDSLQHSRTTTTTTTTPQPETTTLSPYAPFITNGQLTPQLPIFELSAFRKNIPMPMEPPAPGMLELGQLLPGAAVSYLHMTPAGGTPVRIPLLTHTRPALDLDPQQHYLFKRDDSSTAGKQEEVAADPMPAAAEAKRAKRGASAAKEAAEEEAAAAAAAMEPQKIGKRQPEEARADSKRDAKRAKPRKAAAEGDDKQHEVPAVEEEAAEAAAPQADKKKRQTISLHGGPVELGGDVDTSLLSQGLSGLLPHGEMLGSYIEFHGNSQQLLGPLPPKKEPPPLKKETEPAEGEVMAVMGVCSGCSPDPFAKVNIISWQGTPKKLYSGVLYLPAKPMCRKF